jgi:iron-sulfur cluster assembly protein CyaY
MLNDGLTEQKFEQRADETLRALDRALADVDGTEVDLESGILTIEFGDTTKYVINSHRAARQIWMAAERNAWHFDYREEDARWIASKTGDELWQAIDGVIARKLGRPIGLAR